MNINDAYNYASKIMITNMMESDADEGISAFIDKRQPKWINTSLLLDRNLALEAVRVTEIATIASSFHMGRGNEKAADQSAVNAMRDFLNELDVMVK